MSATYCPMHWSLGWQELQRMPGTKIQGTIHGRGGDRTQHIELRLDNGQNWTINQQEMGFLESQHFQEEV